MKIQKIIFTLLFLFTTFQIGFAQDRAMNNNCSIPFKLKFEKTGVLFLLLEPHYFEPPKLKSLFLCLSQKRSKLTFLNITALSNEEQLDRSIKDFTKKYDGHMEAHIRYSERSRRDWKPTLPPPSNYYRAYYYRYQNEYFEYSPDPQEWEMKTVVLRNKGTKK